MASSAPDETSAEALSTKLETTQLEASRDDGGEEVQTAQERATDLLESSYNVVVKLADQQADVNSPLYSISSFEDLGLHDDLLKGLYNMKFAKPSKIQERALPLLLQNPPRNMIAQSQSGTGKTAAFALTILSRINYDLKAPQALVLSPSRELARQTMEVIQEMGKFTQVTLFQAIKDENTPPKVTAHVIVGTPGTVTDLIKRRVIDSKNIRLYVLDEADNMLDLQGLGDQSRQLKRFLPRDCQIVLFSATWADRVRKFAEEIAVNANQITLRPEELSVDGIKQFYVDCRDQTRGNKNRKYDILVGLYSLLTVSQSIIFVKRRDTADEIAQKMSEKHHAVVSLHGKLEATQRDEVIDSFRAGKSKVLITTNVIARGIDIANVNMVVNYDMPTDQYGRPDPETYLHRIGRTGRFGRTGVSVNFIHDDKSMEVMREIEGHFDRRMIQLPEDLDEAEEIIKKAMKAP
ncbi:RNA helicase required for poly(A+) mRNA export [Lobosporangium transversale]|uniref:RNA helicase n=1 Tax=Lobosporangium transversale TaxID=64571 RepID=A0A1Y2G6L7_9FUNG|nr:ATP-dependent RNA helicase DBP5 [Lobosporangium transversale]KAF9898359.1 RNA helicase required for poly(A+) mRNA export [Lobosporangium transversale]ORY93649.1 ATP-dependent RNA helicase DBP5 [Lobosporangium transversale]|eukprot:XP_021875144.1 ATP-dependent RNA helicase DBP5 [Lobosporangium transversale]